MHKYAFYQATFEVIKKNVTFEKFMNVLNKKEEPTWTL